MSTGYLLEVYLKKYILKTDLRDEYRSTSIDFEIKHWYTQTRHCNTILNT